MATKAASTAKLKQLIRVSEVMTMLGYSESSVRRLIADGHLPAYQFDRGTIRVDLADVEAYIEAARMHVGPKGGEPR